MSAIPLIDRTYAGIRGFNYVPSTAASIWDMIDRFEPETWDREFGYATRFGTNTIRIWLDHQSWYRNPQHVVESVGRILDIGERHGIRLLPTLANRWVSGRYPFGGVDLYTVLRPSMADEYREYVAGLVGAFRDDERVLMWDLCNEPFSFPPGTEGAFKQELKEREMGFWRDAFAAARSASPSQPPTIGLLEEAHNYPVEIHSLVDVISCHPYQHWDNGGAGFLATCDAYVGLANRAGKPLLASEACQGSLDDVVRRGIVEFCLGALEERGIGWLAWQLMEGLMQTARRDRPDPNCRPGDGGVHFFVQRDGTTRPHHEESAWRTW